MGYCINYFIFMCFKGVTTLNLNHATNITSATRKPEDMTSGGSNTGETLMSTLKMQRYVSMEVFVILLFYFSRSHI